MFDPPALDFMQVRPRPPLSLFVEAIWAVRGSSGYQRFTMLPNGAVQLMVNFGLPHTVTSVNGRAVHRAHQRAWIAGLQDQPLKIESPPTSDLLSIRFLPGGAHAFLPLPLQAITHDVVDADDLLGASIGELRERLALAGSRDAQRRITEDWLLARLRPREHEFRLVARACAALGAQPSSVRAACEDLGLSNKHVIDVFRRLTGLPPKTLASVQRFHRALGLLARADRAHGEVALQAGYYDQAHFNREFRRFAGATPSDFVRTRGEDHESLIRG
jgi:AraC-like DNA-binding protein